MILMGLDFETTGVDALTCDVVEIGAVAWDTAIQAPLGVFSTFVQVEKEKWSDEAAEHHKISFETTKKFGIPAATAFGEFEIFWGNYGRASTLVAHNGLKFDFPLLKRFSSLCVHMAEPQLFIDTRFHLPLKDQTKAGDLTSLAASLQILNYHPHRAFSDVLTMFSVMSKFDLKQVLERAASPLRRIRVETPKPWSSAGKAHPEYNETVKKYRFYFDPENGNTWAKEGLGSDLLPIFSELQSIGLSPKVEEITA